MIKVKGLRKKFITGKGEVKAVAGIDFEVAVGEFFTLLGPSGCGKSTTLRCIAGLERPEEGEIMIGDKAVFSAQQHMFVPPNERDIAMVFQSYAIWPHMTVFGNVAYPLEGKMPKARIRQRVMEILEMVQIQELVDRPAPQLSGGQQQRIALARALAKGAKVLLLDEPLSNLDAKMRAHMRSELRELHRHLSITTVYVTHDQEEALSLSTTVALMHEGHLVEMGSPTEIYRYPKTKFTADFVGGCNMLPGRVVRNAERFSTVLTALGEMECLVPRQGEDTILITIRPEHIEVMKMESNAGERRNVFRGTVVSALFLGRFGECNVQVGPQNMKVHVPSFVDVTEGEEIRLYFPPERCVALPVN